MDINRPAPSPPEAPAAPALQCSGLVKRFGKVEALAGLDIVVESGKILALLGPSGCGKTTALRLIAGFEQPDAGEISLNGRIVSSPAGSLPPEKRRIGMVFQEGALFPHLTVEQNVGYGLRKDADRGQRISDALDMVGLSGMRQRMPHELSGGQQQRVALGRALAPRPEILLMDEPFSSLDAKLKVQLQRDVVAILRANGVTALFVTHDQRDAMTVGDEVAVMNAGRLEQIGSPASVFHSPETKFVAEFIGDVDFIPVAVAGGAIASELGPLTRNGRCDEGHGCADGNPPSTDDAAPDLEGRFLELMVRPDCLECSLEDSGQGVIVEREFQGAFYLYRIRLPSGLDVRCLLSHVAELPVGAAVALRLRKGHTARLFVDGRLAGSAA